MMANPFSTASLSRGMAASIPRGTVPQIKNAYDVLALAAHASMLGAGFRLIGLSDDDRLETPSESEAAPQALPHTWNASSGGYSFRYAHAQSSMEYILKINRMGTKAVVIGMAIGDDKTSSFDVSAKDYVRDTELPSSPVSNDEDAEAMAIDNLSKLFLTNGRLSDFGSLMLLRIIHKLAPGIHKEGYEASTEGESSRQDNAANREPQQPAYDPLREERDPPARPHPLLDPLAGPPGPRRPLPEPIPGFEDEYEMQRPMRGGMPGGGFPRIGDRDLYPAGLGPNDPFRGGGGPGFGPMGGGGMHPTFDDPLFTGQGRRGPGYDPQAPPGSRYDPVGPGLGPGHPRGAGMGGRPPNPFGGFGDGDFI